MAEENGTVLHYKELLSQEDWDSIEDYIRNDEREQCVLLIEELAADHLAKGEDSPHTADPFGNAVAVLKGDITIGE